MSRVLGVPPGKQGKGQRKKGGVSTPLVFGIQNSISNGHNAAYAAGTGKKISANRERTITYNEVGAELTEDLAAIKVGYENFTHTSTIIGVNNAFLANVVPATFGTGAREIVEKVMTQNPGQPYYIFELINEPYNDGEKGSNASDYAKLVQAAYEAVEAAKIPLWPAAGGAMLLVAAHMTYQKKTSEKVAGEFSDWTTGHGWMKDLIEAWPGGAAKINGWYSHPYGEPNVAASAEGNNHIASGKLQHDTAVTLGFNSTGTNNWWFTEFGYDVSAGGGFGEGNTIEQQRTKLKQALEQMLPWRAEGWLKGVIVFADGAANWGIWGAAEGERAAKMFKEFAEAHG